MANSNCLEGVQCPECGQDSAFYVQATITCFVTDDGSEPTGDHHWDETSATACPICDHKGSISDFRKGANPMKRYSVLLAYPEMLEDGEPETYYAWVSANSPIAAIKTARQEAVAAQEGMNYLPNEFTVLAVLEGHQQLLHGAGEGF